MASGYDYFNQAAGITLDSQSWQPILAGSFAGTSGSITTTGSGAVGSAANSAYQFMWPLDDPADPITIHLHYQGGNAQSVEYAIATWIQADGSYYSCGLNVSAAGVGTVNFYRLTGPGSVVYTLLGSYSYGTLAAGSDVYMRLTPNAGGTSWLIQTSTDGATYNAGTSYADPAPLPRSLSAGVRAVVTGTDQGAATKGLLLQGYWQGPVDFSVVNKTIGGQAATYLVPNSYNSATPATLCIYNHGVGDSNIGVQYPTVSNLIGHSLDAGHIWCATIAHGDNFGSPAALADYLALYADAIANYNIGKVIIFSGSMGGMSGLLSITNSTTIPVNGWYGAFPLCNLAYAYSSENFASLINAAYGCNSSTYATATAGHDPLLLPASAFSRVPYYRAVASQSDATVIKSSNADMLISLLAGTVIEASELATTGVHGDPSNFRSADFLAFVQRATAPPLTYTATPSANAYAGEARTIKVVFNRPLATATTVTATDSNATFPSGASVTIPVGGVTADIAWMPTTSGSHTIGVSHSGQVGIADPTTGLTATVVAAPAGTPAATTYSLVLPPAPVSGAESSIGVLFNEPLSAATTVTLADSNASFPSGASVAVAAGSSFGLVNWTPTTSGGHTIGVSHAGQSGITDPKTNLTSTVASATTTAANATGYILQLGASSGVFGQAYEAVVVLTGGPLLAANLVVTVSGLTSSPFTVTVPSGSTSGVATFTPTAPGTLAPTVSYTGGNPGMAATVNPPAFVVSAGPRAAGPLTPSGLNFNGLYHGGLSGQINGVILANPGLSAETIAGLKSAGCGSIDRTYLGLSELITEYLRGAPISTQEMQTWMVDYVAIFNGYAQAVGEIAALVQANPGTLQSVNSPTGTSASWQRTFNLTG